MSQLRHLREFYDRPCILVRFDAIAHDGHRSALIPEEGGASPQPSPHDDEWKDYHAQLWRDAIRTSVTVGTDEKPGIAHHATSLAHLHQQRTWLGDPDRFHADSNIVRVVWTDTPERYRVDAQRWLNVHWPDGWDQLLMRPPGDHTAADVMINKLMESVKDLAWEAVFETDSEVITKLKAGALKDAEGCSYYKVMNGVIGPG